MAKRKRFSWLEKEHLVSALKQSLTMLNPFVQARNPVMFVTYVGTLLVTFLLSQSYLKSALNAFEVHIAIWLWFTVLFANFAQGIAESRGKAQVVSLKKTQIHTNARKVTNGVEEQVIATDLHRDDIIVCEAGDIIPADGEVIEGIATVDESCITGESAPVIRESGSDRSAVTAGTKLLSDRIIVKVTCEPGGTFLDRMIHLIENAKRQKTPNEVALNIVLAMLTILFLIAVASLKSFADYSSLFTGAHVKELVTVPVLVGLLVCLIPTTIGALLTAVGIAGMDRLIQHNVIAKSGSAVEAAGDINLLLMDKTGTITLGNRMAAAFIPIQGNSEKEFAEVAQLASIQDETPEGRSIVVLAKEKHNLRAHDLTTQPFRLVPFSARTRMSGIDFLNMNGEVVRSLRKGAMDAIDAHVQLAGNHFPHDARETVETIAKAGGTPLVVAENGRVLGVIYLKDILKGGIRERFNKLRQMGIRTVMVTGDNPLTASSIAAEAGVDDFLAEATPEMKLEKIKTEQKRGRLVAMAGDGTNDAPALACADVGVAMNLGTQASREAGNLVDLDSDPSKLIEIVEIGKQLLMTRGALTTFSVANDIAKYFAILPALFGGLYPLANGQGALQSLNIMHLNSPQSAILSAVIFNALIIIALIPLALFGVKIKAKPAHQLLSRNLLIFGLGGIIAPFIGIKLIDIILSIIGIA